MVKVFRKWKLIVSVVGLGACFGMIFFYLPKEILNSLPATGGDTGSHFWPLHSLVKHALPHFHVKIWNPGNLGGEPQLVHYFPLPFLIMALLSVFMPLGTAFNIGTMLPVIAFPLCVYFSFRFFRLKFPIPLLASGFSLAYLYNESFSMWGGNTLSTLAGQFAHVYAFDFFLIGIGVLAWELRKSKTAFLSAFFFAAVLTSHFYVALMLPFVFVAFLFFDRSMNFTKRLRHLAVSGILANLLAAWFVIPMLDNAKWTSAYSFQWQSENILKEVFPVVFWPYILMMCLGSILFLIASFYKKSPEREWQLSLPLWLLLLLVSTLFYFIFPIVGLVDIRAFPQVQMAVCFIAAIYVGLFCRRYLSKKLVLIVALVLSASSIWWTSRQVVNFSNWCKWNYSGWQSKPAYPELKRLYKLVHGDFSDPRIAYENNEIANEAGTIRVFEMLPYFSGRATTESVYHQATVFSPFAFYFQSLISKTPSCPFSQFPCAHIDGLRTADYLDLLGISQLIVITPEVVKELENAPHLNKVGSFGKFTLFEKKTPTRMVDVVSAPVTWSTTTDIKREFYNWFVDYKPGKAFMLSSDGVSIAEKNMIAEAVTQKEECHPELKVDYDRLDLNTDCPGKLHLLKFAYHAAWKSLNGERLYMISPAYIGIIPKENHTTLTWGDRGLWNAAVIISWLTFLGMFLFILRRKIKKEGPL